MATVKRLRELGALDVQVGPVSARFAAPPPEPQRPLEPREIEEVRKEREAAAARERQRLEGWSA